MNRTACTLAVGLLVIPILGVAALTTPEAKAQMSPSCGVPLALDDGWPIDTPEALGFDRSRLCGLADRLREADDVHSVVVARHGRLVFERYFAGYDEPWGYDDKRYEFDATMKHDMRSVSKSIVSLLTGIAIDRRLIDGVDAPALPFFPEMASTAGEGWAGVRLGDLLTMSSGISWDENRAWTDPKNDEPYLGSEADPIRYVFSKPIVTTPGTRWNYNGGGVDLLGTILARQSGQSLDAFARDALFAPLGITDFEWQTYRNGKVSAAAGLRLRPRDATKIGQLVLNKGVWQGASIVPADWIEQSVVPRFQALGYFGGLFFYGRFWWLGRTLSGGQEVPWISAMGLGGQRIFIVPTLDLVVTSTSGLYTDPRQGTAALDMLGVIIAAVRE
ncbi:CubicO group peptidase, beta-lactamase class C family [Bradyrhizobium erythrophlei]|uniref:CubicO group peptidase, beta-lactamase class C family n=2 Tax=Bradyrhizobium erythrophlei TaxID=1437360 RepID=A0A1M5GB23_9BRAD|nr:CubicO group peptidase, beta-lactamase class C family [Bradyrhizobium erythrophlei]